MNDVFRCVTFWGWCGSCDGDICNDDVVGAAVVGGVVWVELYVKRLYSWVILEV